MRQCVSSRCWMVLAGLLFLASSGLAQYPPPGTTTESAQEKFRRAEANVTRFESDARASLKQSPAWIEAQREADAASQDLEKSRDDSLKEARQSQPFIDAQSKLTKAEQIIEKGNQGGVTSRQITTATNDAIDARLEITKLEADALGKSSEFRNAQARLESARSALDNLWKGVKHDQLDANRSYRAAVAARDTAAQELKASQESARIARQQMAAQQQASRPQRTPTQRPSRSSGRMGRSGGGGY